ncbi:MAG: PQQ-dependent sugar dehydrogenase, partial [Marinobacter sp.]|nr:PQQ-dependent sugar dehydrogenase [Marinobacter sp.]
MAAPVSWWKVILAFVIALVVGSVLGSLVQTHFNLEALEALEVEITMGTRLETSIQDLVNFAPLYAILFGISLLFSLGLASLVARLAGNLRRAWLYPLAAAVGLWVTLKVVDTLAPMPTLIAATRGTGGLVAMLVTAAISGWLFAALVSRPTRRNRGYPTMAVMALTVAGSLTLPESDAMAEEQPGYRIETVAQGLEHPWSLAFLPDGRMLVTERPGRLRMISAEGELLPDALDG